MSEAVEIVLFPNWGTFNAGNAQVVINKKYPRPNYDLQGNVVPGHPSTKWANGYEAPDGRVWMERPDDLTDVSNPYDIEWFDRPVHRNDPDLSEVYP